MKSGVSRVPAWRLLCPSSRREPRLPGRVGRCWGRQRLWVSEPGPACSHGAVTFLPQEEEAKKLVSEAIGAGIFNDLGSGSNIDLCVISKSKLDFLRPYSVPNKKGAR